MPSSSAKQKRFMAAVAHNPEFAAKVGVPQSVGREFNLADMARGTKPKRRGTLADLAKEK